MSYNKLFELREDTFTDFSQKLNKYKKCALIRPTGFGKTYLLARLLKQYKNVLFIAPSKNSWKTIIEAYGTDNIPNTTFLPCKTLIMKTKADFEAFGKVDLIIFDECHRMGAKETYKTMKSLLRVFPDVPLAGATATPERSDLIDIIHDFFDDIVVSEYNLHHAFQDKILQRPAYCFCSYGDSDLNEIEKSARKEIDLLDKNQKETALQSLNARLIEMSNLLNMSNIIRDVCNEHLEKNTSYYKFIVFFSSFTHLHTQSEQVLSWFQNAFPHCTTDTITVTSETKETADNLDLIYELQPQENHIDLIFCVDMLNLGAHLKDLSGIVMYRSTQSSIVFIQQLGRALSSGATKPCVVFDCVDNIHRESLKSILKKNLPASKTATEHWWTHANDLFPEDLISVGHMASYQELYNKIISEPIQIRCRQAWNRWLEQGGDDSVMTREAILSKKPPEFVPLEPFCRLKEVTIEQVFQEMSL